MIIIGLLLVLGVVGLTTVAITTNQGAFSSSAGAVELLGYDAQLNNGQVFLAGSAAGAVFLLGMFLLFRGLARSARRRAATRRELRELKRERDTASAAANRAAKPRGAAPEHGKELANR